MRRMSKQTRSHYWANTCVWCGFETHTRSTRVVHACMLVEQEFVPTIQSTYYVSCFYYNSFCTPRHSPIWPWQLARLSRGQYARTRSALEKWTWRAPPLAHSSIFFKTNFQASSMFRTSSHQTRSMIGSTTLVFLYELGQIQTYTHEVHQCSNFPNKWGGNV